MDSAVAPAGVLASQPEHQGLDGPAGGWPAGPAALGPGGPAAPDDVAVPAQDRVRGDQQPQRLAPRFRYHSEQGRKQGSVRPVQVRAARLPPLHDGGPGPILIGLDEKGEVSSWPRLQPNPGSKPSHISIHRRARTKHPHLRVWFIDRAELVIMGGQGTVPRGTTHCTGWAVTCAISS